MADVPTQAELDALRAAHDKSAKDLRDAEAAVAAIPPMPQADAEAIYQNALAAIEADPNHAHEIATDALTELEAGKVKGRCIDVLAQHILTGRGEAHTDQPTEKGAK